MRCATTPCRVGRQQLSIGALTQLLRGVTTSLLELSSLTGSPSRRSASPSADSARAAPGTAVAGSTAEPPRASSTKAARPPSTGAAAITAGHLVRSPESPTGASVGRSARVSACPWPPTHDAGPSTRPTATSSAHNPANHRRRCRHPPRVLACRSPRPAVPRSVRRSSNQAQLGSLASHTHERPDLAPFCVNPPSEGTS